MFLPKTRKEEQIEPQVNRKKEIVKIAEVSAVENGNNRESQ